MAVRDPGLLASLTLMETQLPGISPPPNVAAPLTSFQFFFNAVPGLAEVLTEGRAREYLTWLFDHKATVRDAITPADLDEYLRSYGDPARMSAGFGYYRAVSKNIAQHGPVTGLRTPALVVGAENGVGRSLEEAVRDRFADLSGEVIPGVGHYVLEECPERVATLITRFLETLSVDPVRGGALER